MFRHLSLPAAAVMSEGMLRIRGTYIMDRKGGAFDQRRPSWLSKAALLTSQSCCRFWCGLLADLGKNRRRWNPFGLLSVPSTNKADVSLAQINQDEWLTRKYLGFIKMKVHRVEVSTETWIWRSARQTSRNLMMRMASCMRFLPMPVLMGMGKSCPT